MKPHGTVEVGNLLCHARATMLGLVRSDLQDSLTEEDVERTKSSPFPDSVLLYIGIALCGELAAFR
jgi:hypothetical protein